MLEPLVSRLVLAAATDHGTALLRSASDGKRADHRAVAGTGTATGLRLRRPRPAGRRTHRAHRRRPST